MLLALAMGLWLGPINVRYRDVKHTLPFLLQVWMYASPIVYPLSMVPEKWQALYSLNPMVGVIEGFRWALLGTGQPDFAAIGISFVVIARRCWWAAWSTSGVWNAPSRTSYEPQISPSSAEGLGKRYRARRAAAPSTPRCATRWSTARAARSGSAAAARAKRGFLGAARRRSSRSATAKTSASSV